MNKNSASLIRAAAMMAVLPSLNVLRVAAAVKDGETVTIDGDVYEADSAAASAITSGNIRIDLSGSSAAPAVGTLTSDNTNVSDGDTVTIGSTVYRFKNTMAQAYDVKIGADADASLLNLIKAINASGTAGTDYYAGTLAHPSVTAATSVTSHAFAVTSILKGTAANAIASTETSSHLSWGASTLASGADATADEFTDALEAVINAAQRDYVAEKISANEVVVYGSGKHAQRPFACSETLSGSNNAWAAATAYGGGTSSDSLKAPVHAKRSPNAAEVALGTFHAWFPFPPSAVVVQVRTSAGAIKAIDDTIGITGNRVTITSAGSTHLAATDTVTVIAFP